MSLAVCAALTCPILTYGDPVSRPDSIRSTPDNPNWRLREVGPAGGTVTVWITHDGRRIRNADGTEVGMTSRIGVDGQTVFTIPGMINGLTTTDAQQKTYKPGDEVDPGTLFFSVFNDGIMTQESISNWLTLHLYIGDTEIFMPDFFPVGFTDVYYGVNLEELFDAGADFVDAHSFEDVFTIDASGRIPELPMYTFSSTPLVYVPGVGWSGTPLSTGTQVQYVAFHAASSEVPEPGTMLLLGTGLAGVVMRNSLKTRKRAKQSNR